MKSVCDAVVERIALDEPLGELAAHAAQCDRCQRTIALPGQLRATRHAIDPGLGFSARMTVAAQHRLGERRRRRLMASAGAAVALAAGAVFAVTRPPANEPQPGVQPLVERPESPTAEHRDLTFLIRASDTRRAARSSARWNRIERPLKPYVQLVKGVTP